MPFTDPMADGPGHPGRRAARPQGRPDHGQDAGHGAAVPSTRRPDRRSFSWVISTRSTSMASIVSWPTPRAAGVDGLIIVDLPPEEDGELCLPAIRAGLSFIRLATPTTDERRLPAVLANTSGFLYYVSVLGITGTKTPEIAKVAREVARIRQATTLPIAVGFGVKSEDQVRGAGGPLRRRCRRLRAHPPDRRVSRSGRAGHRLDGAGASGTRVNACPWACPCRRIGRRASRPRRAREMNWIKNFVRPKIRSFLGVKRELPDNMWVKCPETGEMVFYRDLEANQFVIPNSGHHMRMPPRCPARRHVRRRRIRGDRPARGLPGPAQLPRRAALCRPPQGGPHQDRAQ